MQHVLAEFPAGLFCKTLIERFGFFGITKTGDGGRVKSE